MNCGPSSKDICGGSNKERERMSPIVSVIISAYNAEATLERCLNSVLTQSLRDIEVLCIDDGSTDGTLDILRRYVAHEARLHVYSFEKNYGILIATKQGLRESRGDYVMFVDSDDALLPGACENLVRLIREYDVDVLQFGVKINADNHKVEDVDYYWYHDLHCSQAVLRWRGKRRKLEVHWEFVPW